MRAVRRDIFNLIHRGIIDRGENLSLYFSRLCREIDEPAAPPGTRHLYRQEAIRRLEAGIPEAAFTLYRRAFTAWREAWRCALQARVFILACETPLIVGLGDQSVHEFGLSLQHPWGVPFIPGSAVKGVTASFASRLGAPPWQRLITGNTPDGEYAEAVFGGVNASGNRTAGGIAFVDAWWIPDTQRPYQADIINVHYQKYYQGATWPDGVEAPVPVQFAVLKPETRFLMVLCGDAGWTRVVQTLVCAAVRTVGLGAKTRVGYGRMRHEETPGELIARLKTMTPEELVDITARKKNAAEYATFFKQAAQQFDYSENLRELFELWRPARALLEALHHQKPETFQSARNIRQQFNTKLPSGTIDPEDADIRAIFDFGLPLSPQQVTGTWLEAFAYRFSHMVKGKTYSEMEDLLVRHLDSQHPWPTRESIAGDINSLNTLTLEEKAELLQYLEL